MQVAPWVTWHLSGAVSQLVPQAPQLLVLVVVSTQVPPQLVWPVGQHMPLEQTLPLGQAVPHAPQ
jgi:hypothetical protein